VVPEEREVERNFANKLRIKEGRHTHFMDSLELARGKIWARVEPRPPGLTSCFPMGRDVANAPERCMLIRCIVARPYSGSRENMRRAQLCAFSARIGVIRAGSCAFSTDRMRARMASISARPSGVRLSSQAHAECHPSRRKAAVRRKHGRGME